MCGRPCQPLINRVVQSMPLRWQCMHAMSQQADESSNSAESHTLVLGTHVVVIQ